MTFTKVTVSKTAQVLTSAADTLLVENLRLFHDTLELPASHFEILRLRHLLGAEGYYGVFSKILEEWVNQSGLSASTDMLIRVLKEIEFISVAEKLEQEFPANLLIIISPSTLPTSENSTTPNQLPIYFQVGHRIPILSGDRKNCRLLCVTTRISELPRTPRE
ncbi:hypothetical protein Fcan01_01580 [Folsomia candida]|uniref:Death domain-containing protein n=1 Tax=Folsomia candida TaxID=158441 RepID=A0A226F581_FOLCA|nr:hypothetical protein Fcan01_01580 [Folsomia candida]